MRIQLTLLVITTALTGLAAACDDHSSNICTTGEKQCQPLPNPPYQWSNGSEVGLLSSLTKADLTVGCYCQLAEVDHSFDDGFELLTALDPNMLVTSCTKDMHVYYNGKDAMNVTGGTLGGNYDIDAVSFKYRKMSCVADLAGAIVPNDQLGIAYDIGWTNDLDTLLEVKLPSNVAFFNGPKDTCPGGDAMSVFAPNNIVATVFPTTNAQVQNCTCHEKSVTSDGPYPPINNEGGYFYTVCDQSYGVFFNGKGWRTARNGAQSGSSTKIYDICTNHDNAETGVVYVKGRGSTSNVKAGQSVCMSLTLTVLSLASIILLFA